MKELRVGIVVPLALEKVYREFHQSYIANVTYLQANSHKLPFKLKDLRQITPTTFPINANRDESVEWIKEWDCDISVWFDADQELKNYGTEEQGHDVLFRLLSDGYNYPVYAGIYYLKKPPFTPVLMKTDEQFYYRKAILRYPKDKLFYADIIGMGCVKIDRSVLDKLEKPYFAYSEIPKECKDMGPLVEFKIKHGIQDVSEDVHFWKNVRDNAKVKIVIDPKIQVGHLTTQSITPNVFYQYFDFVVDTMKKEKGAEFDEWWAKVSEADLVDAPGK